MCKSSVWRVGDGRGLVFGGGRMAGGPYVLRQAQDESGWLMGEYTLGPRYQVRGRLQPSPRNGELCVTGESGVHRTLITPIRTFPHQGGRLNREVSVEGEQGTLTGPHRGFALGEDRLFVAMTKSTQPWGSAPLVLRQLRMSGVGPTLSRSGRVGIWDWGSGIDSLGALC